MVPMESKQSSTEYKKTIEAALFVSGRAMGSDEIARVVGVGSVGHVKRMLEELIKDYQSRNSSLMVSKVGDKYVLGVRNEYAEKVNSLAGAPEISKSSLRVLAYISKNEPVMQVNMVKAFGSATYDHVKELGEGFHKDDKDRQDKEDRNHQQVQGVLQPLIKKLFKIQRPNLYHGLDKQKMQALRRGHQTNDEKGGYKIPEVYKRLEVIRKQDLHRKKIQELQGGAGLCE